MKKPLRACFSPKARNHSILPTHSSLTTCGTFTRQSRRRAQNRTDRSSHRLSLGLSAAQRDQVLLKLRQSIFSYNPCRFVFVHDEKAESSIRRAAKNKSPSTCHGCKSSLGFFLIGVSQCYYCYHRFCSNCFGSPTKIIEFMWDKPQPVCRRCNAELVRQAELLACIKQEIGTYSGL